MEKQIAVRRATQSDVEKAAALAGMLVRLHHATDEDRFFLPERVEEGYAWWFGRELAREAAVLLVADAEGEIVGYAYGALEGRDYNLLLEEHGAIHDLFVSEAVRRSGVGRRLLSSMISELESRGARRILLSTMIGNESAQRLFASSGFRATMLEMTRSSPLG